jgi:subtilisin family serine protease
MQVPQKRGGAVLAAATAVATISTAVLVHLSAGSAAAVTPDTSAPARAAAVGSDAAPEPVPTRTVTLLTGDRVTVRGAYAATVEPGPGRTGVQFLTRRVDDHLSVIPSDARSMLRDGRLDARLFDVTTLVDAGYDDRRPDLRLIVTHTPDTREVTLQDITSGGGRMMRDLPSVHGMAVQAQKSAATTLWDALTSAEAAPRTLADGISKIWLDGVRRPTLDRSVPQIGAPAAWAAGYDGAGVTVAVLDTGVDATHADLAGKVVAEENFTEGTEGDQDLVGHGTHVASTVAGNGAVYRGVAPGARLLDGKVCVADGCNESWILGGMQWAAQQGAKVVNLSLGGPDTAEVDPLEQAVQNLSAEHGTLFAVAAGNTAPALPVNSPASADAALAVGAVDDDDALADFSAHGPRVADGAIKPDLTAPGVDITAARGADASVGTPGEAYVTLSGTSMATPHAAGAAAIVAQQHPDWTGAQLKAALMTAAKPNPDLDVFAQGNGRLDVAKAVTQTVTATPASLSFGRQAWPHDDDTAVARTVTYRNDGSSPVTLALAVSAASPTGQASAAFTVDKPSVTVPAGGSAQVAVTADTSVAGPDGFLVGALTATAGDTVVRTPVAVDREVESYQLTLAHLGLDGQPTADFLTVVANWDGSVVRTVPAEGAVRVPRGSYSVMSVVTSPRPDQTGWVFAVLGQPRLDVSADQAVTLDARLAQPVSVTAPGTPVFSEVSTLAKVGQSTVEVGTLGGNFSAVAAGEVGPQRTAQGFATRVAGTFVADEPAAYLLTWYTDGRVPDGFTRTATTSALATVLADHAGQATQTEGRKSAWSAHPQMPVGGFAAALGFKLPSVRTEYYNTDGGGMWGRALDEVTPGDQPQYVTSTVAPLTTYQPGQSYQEAWNRGVFGPTVAAPQLPEQWVTRTGDQMRVLSPLYGDGAGRAGYSSIATATTTVYRNGEKLAEVDTPTGEFDVPAGVGDYRVQIVSERAAPAELSTRVEVAWTFSSGHVAGDTPTRLPVSTVQFSPPVDNVNTAPAGRPASIPVTLRSQPGSPAGSLRTLAVQVSYDDGGTWAAVPVMSGPTRAQVTHPGTAGFVSLRATATDTAGNTVTQTVIRAYRIG